MKLYFAGVPAGLQRDRERDLPELGVHNRFIAFFYSKKALTTIKYFKGVDEIGIDEIKRARDYDT